MERRSQSDGQSRSKWRLRCFIGLEVALKVIFCSGCSKSRSCQLQLDPFLGTNGRVAYEREHQQQHITPTSIPLLLCPQCVPCPLLVCSRTTYHLPLLLAFPLLAKAHRARCFNLRCPSEFGHAMAMLSLMLIASIGSLKKSICPL